MKKKPQMKTDKILSYLGLAAASRSAVCGTKAVLDEVRKRKQGICVLVAEDVSERSAKQLSDKCGYYNVPLIKIPCDMYLLGQRLGKKSPVAATAVTNPSLARQIINCVRDA